MWLHALVFACLVTIPTAVAVGPPIEPSPGVAQPPLDADGAWDWAFDTGGAHERWALNTTDDAWDWTFMSAGAAQNAAWDTIVFVWDEVIFG